MEFFTCVLYILRLLSEFIGDILTFFVVSGYARGYIVSPFGQDGFALLKAERVQEALVHEDQYFPPEDEPDI